MPILLTTPFNPGDSDPGKTYAELKITSFALVTKASQIHVTCEFGDTVAGVFTEGKEPSQRKIIMDIPDDLDTNGDPIPNTGSPDFTNLLAKTSAASGERYYDEVARELYTHFIAKGDYAGTIV